jgi:hypothetical protein
MPVNPVHRLGKDGKMHMIGYKWGSSGKVYQIRSFGKAEAYRLALKQGIAVKISQMRN